MTFGVDYSAARPSISVLKQYHTAFVCRYVAAIDQQFNLTADEVKSLVKAGIAIVPTFETYPSRALGGYNAGVNDAKDVEKFLEQVGLPRDSVVYFTVDFNPDMAQMESVKEYFRGIVSIHSVVLTGVYGGYMTVRTLKSYGLVGYVWQTYAWSSGQWFSGANIRQERNGVNWPGGQVDYNSSFSRDFGQYPKPHSPAITGTFGEDDDMQVLDLKPNGPAIVLGVPANAKHVEFHADPGFRGHVPPKVRVGMHPPWGEHTVSPAWGNFARLQCDGVQEITIARLDTGECPVTVVFTS